MIRVLIGLGLGVALVTGAFDASAQDHKYVGVKKCRTCHKKELIGNQYGEWKKAGHAKAFETLKGDEAVKIAKEKGLPQPPHESEECLKCHVTAFGVEAAQIKYPVKQTDGIQCESCHGPGADYRKKKIMSDRDKAVAKGLWDPGEDEKICTNCHNDESPSWDPAKYELADGSKVGFDYEQAKDKIKHPIPEDVKGKYLEIEKKRRAERKAKGEAPEEDEDEEDED